MAIEVTCMICESRVRSNDLFFKSHISNSPSSPPVDSVCSDNHVAVCTVCLFPSSFSSCVPSLNNHTATEFVCEATSNRSSLGENVTQVGKPRNAFTSAIGFQLVVSHTATVKSLLPVARYFPSLEKAMQVIGSL